MILTAYNTVIHTSNHSKKLFNRFNFYLLIKDTKFVRAGLNNPLFKNLLWYTTQCWDHSRYFINIQRDKLNCVKYKCRKVQNKSVTYVTLYPLTFPSGHAYNLSSSEISKKLKFSSIPILSCLQPIQERLQWKKFYRTVKSLCTCFFLFFFFSVLCLVCAVRL